MRLDDGEVRGEIGKVCVLGKPKLISLQQRFHLELVDVDEIESCGETVNRRKGDGESLLNILDCGAVSGCSDVEKERHG